MSDVESILLGGNSNSTAWDELYKYLLDNRILVINGSVDDNVIEDYILFILKWNKEDKNLPVDKREPIRIFISSPGGNVFNANIFIDIITASKTPIWGIGLDLVASAAYLVYLACHKRFSHLNTTFLQHEGELALENSRSKLKQTVSYFDEGEVRAKEYILSRTKIDSDFYDEIYDQEYWMFAEKAKELGVVEYIIGVDCELEDVL